MPTDVIMPALGAAQDTGTLLSWFKHEGETVVSGEPLMLVETDKTTVELEAPASGTLAAVTAAEGDEVAVGTVIALILTAGEALPEVASAGGTPPAGADREPTGADSVPTGSVAEPAPPPAAGRERPVGAAAAHVSASPKVRRLAAERGIDLAAVAGSGPGGAIVAADLGEAPVEDREPAGGADAGAPPGAALRDSSVWRSMASNVTSSWQAVPHFYLSREVRATALAAARELAGPPVTYTDLLVVVLSRTLAEHPFMLAAQESAGIGIGIAVGTPAGLFVPVIHGADRLDLAEVTERRRDLVERVRSRKHTVQDMTGAGFTLSNLGMYGVDSFQAIVTDGQAGILAVGRVAERVIARDGNFAVAPTMALSLSCDHRLTDGVRAAEFLSALADALENGAALADLLGTRVPS